MRSDGWTPREIQAAAMCALLVRAAPPIFAQRFGPRCCINATRVGMDALRRFRVESFPLPVKVAAFSPKAAEKVVAGKPLTREEGEWMVLLGDGSSVPDDEGYDGHLVLMVARRFLVDLSIGQVSRPERGIEAGPFWMDVGRDFVRQGAERAFRSKQGTLLSYKCAPERGAWKDTPGWHPKRNEPVLLEVVDALTRLVEERNAKET